MAYKGKISGRIEKYPCDVIINSLGVDTTDYGLICKSILDASNDKAELEGIIQRANDVYDVGEYFFTDSYGLPTKAICHLITPNRDNDDDNLDVFIHSIKNVLMSCRELDYKTIGIPLVGTGANKYDPNIIYSLLVKICSSFCEYFTSMSVTIITPDDSTVLENDSRLMNELNNRGGITIL